MTPLEQALHENTLAIRDLIAKLPDSAVAILVPKMITTAPPRIPIDDVAPTAAGSANVKGNVQATAAIPVAAGDVPGIAATPTDAPPSKPAVSYQLLKPMLIEISKTKSRDVLVGLLADFGVSNGTALTADQYAAVLAQAKSILGI